MQEDEWQPIETAPKDGKPIMVMHDDVGSFIMQWGHIQTNEFFAPGQVGMWVAPDRSMTWAVHDDVGPSHWKPLVEAE